MCNVISHSNGMTQTLNLFGLQVDNVMNSLKNNSRARVTNRFFPFNVMPNTVLYTFKFTRDLCMQHKKKKQQH